MILQLIHIDNYLIAVDDSEIKDGVKAYNSKFSIGDIKLIYNELCFVSKHASGGSITTPYKRNLGDDCKKITHYLPLNGSPTLEGVTLLPPLEDDVEKLAKEYTDKRNYLTEEEQGYIDGFNKAKEKYKFTEKDIRKAIITTRQRTEIVGSVDVEAIIQSLSQPKLPTQFNTETNQYIY